ncbi:ABC transporter substrate-binding protein [Sphingomonas sp. OK281]|uniref:ABC transporter substrate-binding protein n=1 Tax=Sphingomonas sp. OK281 TaxID=1881067 RepID=UPI000B84F175|nr:ABC transporter substrate-binding protein [Sphingomonas sp. OK281]
MNSELRAAFAPTGTLRVAINLGNPILAGRSLDTGELHGVSVDLGEALAAELEVPCLLIPYDAAGKAFAGLRDDAVDIAFFAHEPARAAEVALTNPYVLIEGCYLVREGSPVLRNEDVDREGVRLAVGEGSAYDLFLSRTLKQATIERAPTSPAVVEYFLDNNCDVAAGVRQQLEADAARTTGLRILPERFMTIRQAMAVMPSRGQDAIRFLEAFVEQKKTSGFVLRSLHHNDVQGASVPS